MNAPETIRPAEADAGTSSTPARAPATVFADRHIGPDSADEAAMLSVVGAASRAALVKAVMPASIARPQPMRLPPAASEAAALAELAGIASRNRVLRSFIGQGYYGTLTPAVIQRNVLEGPSWYTAYTPYQAEISQGRLEALVNFQTMVADLTGMAVANASMLDESTAAAEAMTLVKRTCKSKSQTVIVSARCHPQTIEVIRTRAQPIGIEVVVGDTAALAKDIDAFAIIEQYPGTEGDLPDLAPLAEAIHARQGGLVVCCDLLALTVLKAPGEFGADIAVGNTQRFGMPMGNGGPHAAFLACRGDYTRSMPGRLVGVSIDAHGNTAYRLALQTREQHIRREKATSNICTAQVLPAIVASMYAVYHGPQGLRVIGARVARLAADAAKRLREAGQKVVHASAFDTVSVDLPDAKAADAVIARAVAGGANLRRIAATRVSFSLDETSGAADVDAICAWFAGKDALVGALEGQGAGASAAQDAGIDPLATIPASHRRSSPYLTHPVFNRCRSETQMLRYMRQLADRDLALDRTMIPLGSCTMKLNATSEMIPITWPGFAQIHPYAPADQREGYRILNEQLCAWLAEATGYAGISLQPNAGSQGEYAGLLAIRAWHASRGDSARTICLIPESAHGTNPASAQMAGMSVVVVKCDANGNVDLVDLHAKCEKHAAQLAAIMITYPSTYGIYEPQVRELCQIVHRHGGRVYVDGANMNALVGLAAPGEFGGDVSHLNLHKTFCIPHGGGGPGVGPVCVAQDLVPFLPADPGSHAGADSAQAGVGPVSAAPLGNAAVLPISWMYIRMMGADGLTHATEAAILSANYIAARLAPHYGIHFSQHAAGIAGGGVAHECILDLRPLKDSSGVTAEDVAKRLIDYGFHAPTLSFPVPGTLMVEPTESEPRAELDRFCDAMIAIREEIRRVEDGRWPREDNPLKSAPHTAQTLLAAEWKHPFTREEAAYPVPALRAHKYWSPVGRVDNVWGDRNFSCSCPPVSAYE